MFPQQIAVNEKNIAVVTRVYKEAYKEIINEIKSATNFGVANRKAILRQIESILEELGTDVNDFIAKEIPTYYRDGADEAIGQLRDVGGKVKVAGGFNRIHREAIVALVDDTQTAFGESIQGVNRSARQLLGKAVREQLSQQMAIGKISGDALETIKATIVGFLERDGLDALVDKAGRGWTLDRYAETLIRTKAVEARNRGLVNRMAENEYDLVQVSAHGADDVCGDWEGKILSLTGQTRGYPTVADAEEDGLFHPNCKHAINALVKDLALKTQAYDDDLPTLEAGFLELDLRDSPLEGITKAPTKGEKYVVYRGEGKDLPVRTLDAYGKGRYYSLDRQYAEIFGDVTETKLTLEKPFIIRSQDDVEMATRAQIEAGFNSLSDWAKAQGYDGIVDKQTEILLRLK